MRKLFLLLVIIVFSTSVNSLAFDHEKTHRRLTEKAIESSKFKDAAYLENNLNLPNGVETSLQGITIQEWLRRGSSFEDEPECRASNHFHNPLKPWSDSGMSDQPWFVNWWCSGNMHK